MFSRQSKVKEPKVQSLSSGGGKMWHQRKKTGFYKQPNRSLFREKGKAILKISNKCHAAWVVGRSGSKKKKFWFWCGKGPR